MYIKSADLIKYNANARGKNVGDCVKRAISLAFDLPYNELTKLLLDKMKQKHAHAWNVRRVYEPVIEELGAHEKSLHGNYTVEEFADEIAQSDKSYIVLCRRNTPGDRSTTHMVCIRDNKIWDSWDCRNWIVLNYYVVDDSVQLKEFTDIKDNLINLCDQYATPIIQSTIDKYITGKHWSGVEYEIASKQTNYSVKYYCNLSFDATETTKSHSYNFEVALVFQPTMTEEDVIEYIRKTAKQKTYDRLWAINEQEKKLLEEAEIKRQAGLSADHLNYGETHYLYGQKRRFYDSLPGWIKPLVTYLDIQQPGMYSDSYQLTILKHPKDSKHPNVSTIEFEGMDASEIKAEIEMYEEDFEAPFLDYHPSEIF